MSAVILALNVLILRINGRDAHYPVPKYLAKLHQNKSKVTTGKPQHTTESPWKEVASLYDSVVFGLTFSFVMLATLGFFTSLCN